MEHEVIRINKNMKAAQDRHKIYADKKKNHKDFNVEDHVYIRVNPKRSSLRMGTCAKLAPCYCGLFEVLERVGPMAYRLDLPLTIKSHNVFHVSLLKKYIHYCNHIIDWTMIQVELEGQFQPNPQHIQERRETFL
jgi:hypothetical protein